MPPKLSGRTQTNLFTKKSIADGRYTPGEVDREWSKKMTREFDKWKKPADIQAVFAEL